MTKTSLLLAGLLALSGCGLIPAMAEVAAKAFPNQPDPPLDTMPSPGIQTYYFTYHANGHTRTDSITVY